MLPRILGWGPQMHFDRLKRREIITLLGCTAAWPIVVGAQRLALPVIGTLNPARPDPEASAVFREGLAQAGYVEGQNVMIEARWADGQYDRLPALAADLVNRRVAVIFTTGTVGAQAAKMATSTIPIVFIMGTDPVKDGVVPSFNHPGGNATGVSNITTGLASKRLQILLDLVPTATVIAFLVNPDTPIGSEMEEAEVVAQATGRQIFVVKASNELDFETAFAVLTKRGAGALLVASDPFFITRRDQLTTLAARHAIPAIYQVRAFTVAGGLMSYGTSRTESYRLAAAYVSQILKGTRPADLPVVIPTKFELVINLKAAKALLLTVPDKLLALADEVIE
jgi:putative tryptophan/tyrosine transport system substrate-binding protein